MSGPRRTAAQMAADASRSHVFEAMLREYAAQECAPLRAALERIVARLTGPYADGMGGNDALALARAALAAQPAPAEAVPQSEIATLRERAEKAEAERDRLKACLTSEYDLELLHVVAGHSACPPDECRIAGLKVAFDEQHARAEKAEARVEDYRRKVERLLAEPGGAK